MELNGGSRGARLARLKIWQISCVAGALSATSLAAIHQVAVSGLSFATPNARVADAFSAIPLNMTAVLADLRAELPEVETKIRYKSIGQRDCCGRIQRRRGGCAILRCDRFAAASANAGDCET